MTEQTQTTVERITALIFDAIQMSPYNELATVAAPLGVAIATEIDALAKTNALMLESAERGQATIAELRAQIDALTAKIKECDDNADFVRELREAEQSTLANTQRLLGVAQATIDALTAERDAARATIAANNAKSEAWEAEAEAQLAEARAEVERIMAIADQERVAYRSDVETERQKADQQLAEARAEVERLRLPAEAWETAEAANVANAKRMGLIMDAHAYGLAKDIWVAAQEQAAAAAARARAAKEKK